MTVQAEIVLPDPVRMIEGLRDTGYKFNTAVADLIDNSIAAEATEIDIRVQMDLRGRITVSIADNGIGMDRDHLKQGMTYGSPERPNPASLGKFGLGLKTASTAFCRKLSVVSRGGPKLPPNKATWDLDHVRDTRKWELLFSDPTPEELQLLDAVAKNSSGTLVHWEKVDRVLKTYQDPGGGHARNALEKQVRQLHQHLSMVYQRYLDLKDKRTSQKNKT